VTGLITPREFHESDGVEDWRVVGDGARGHFLTASLQESVRFAGSIAGLAIEGHEPEIHIGVGGVTIRLVVIAGELWSLTAHEVEMARSITAAAREQGLVADPAAVQTVQVTIGSHDLAEIMPFWQAVLGYDQVGEEDLLDLHGVGAPFWFQQLSRPRQVRNRIHIDVFVPHDQAEIRIAAAVAAGGRLIDDSDAPAGWTLADPVGNVADIATWMGRD